MKTLISLLLASQFLAPTTSAAPTQVAPAPAPAPTVSTTPAPATAPATAPAVTAPAATPTARPQYQTRQSIGLFFGCRNNPNFPWCWR